MHGLRATFDACARIYDTCAHSRMTVKGVRNNGVENCSWPLSSQVYTPKFLCVREKVHMLRLLLANITHPYVHGYKITFKMCMTIE